MSKFSKYIKENFIKVMMREKSSIFPKNMKERFPPPLTRERLRVFFFFSPEDSS